MEHRGDFKVAVVGGGLVGALEACLLAKRGFQVTLFEGRHDGRHEPSYYGRSINLAISLRGISALKRLNLEQIVKERAIPMSARMIHKKSGPPTPIPYDPDGGCINSIERASLNNFLLDKAEQQFNVKILFNHKLVDMNSESGEIWFRLRDSKPSSFNNYQNEADDTNNNNGVVYDSDRILKYKFDLILGCDGARSSVRSLLARQTQLEVQQTYIEHGYLELRIDPNDDGSYKMPENYLHIWPRGQYMMIALPNKDASFTCTLFMPFTSLAELQVGDGQKGLDFFRQNFPDSIELIGADRIRETLSKIRASPLISIKCSPYSFKNKVALLGDAAHAMVPFYGQGMNCGFEDCLVLDELLDKYLPEGLGAVQKIERTNGHSVLVPHKLANTMTKVLKEYNDLRCPNGHAMCELAMYNYIEMRDLVNTWAFAARKYLDNILYKTLGSKWIPLYTMVTFSRIPIHQCVNRRHKQDIIINRCLTGSGLMLALGIGALVATKLRQL